MTLRLKLFTKSTVLRTTTLATAAVAGPATAPKKNFSFMFNMQTNQIN